MAEIQTQSTGDAEENKNEAQESAPEPIKETNDAGFNDNTFLNFLKSFNLNSPAQNETAQIMKKARDQLNDLLKGEGIMINDASTGLLAQPGNYSVIRNTLKLEPSKKAIELVVNNLKGVHRHRALAILQESYEENEKAKKEGAEKQKIQEEQRNKEIQVEKDAKNALDKVSESRSNIAGAKNWFKRAAGKSGEVAWKTLKVTGKGAAYPFKWVYKNAESFDLFNRNFWLWKMLRFGK